MSAAGAKAQLMRQPEVELVGPADLDRARVALVISDAVDESVVKVVRAIQRDGVPKVVLVASRFDENGVVAAVSAGVIGFLRRAEATSSRLTEAILAADQAGCQLPEGLLKRAAAVTASIPDAAHDLTDRSDPREMHPSRSGGVATMTMQLSDREVEVLRLVADGFDTTDIAEQLAFSESTIKGVLAKIMTRFDARNRCHAIAIVVREGLI